MPEVLIACPTDEMLEMLAHNELSELNRESVLDHLAECDACAVRANAIPDEDDSLLTWCGRRPRPAVLGAEPLVEAIRQLWPGSAGDDETYKSPAKRNTDTPRPDTHRLLDPHTQAQHRAMPNGIRRTVAVSGPYDFLAPPQQPEELGRLGPCRPGSARLGRHGRGVSGRRRHAAPPGRPEGDAARDCRQSPGKRSLSA